MWDPPGSGINPVSSALIGDRFHHHELVLGVGPFGQLPMPWKSQAQPESRHVLGMLWRKVLGNFWCPISFGLQGILVGSRSQEGGKVMNRFFASQAHPVTLLIVTFIRKCLWRLIPIATYSTSDHRGSGWDFVKFSWKGKGLEESSKLIEGKLALGSSLAFIWREK